MICSCICSSNSSTINSGSIIGVSIVSGSTICSTISGSSVAICVGSGVGNVVGITSTKISPSFELSVAVSGVGNGVDSWIELWQGATKLRADDDGLHSGTNVLASIITAPIETGFYFIRATSFAWMASNQTQTPTGSYVLTWSGVTTIPTATPTLEPLP